MSRSSRHAVPFLALMLVVSAPAFGQWSIETVDGAGSINRHGSLVLTSAGTPLVAYGGDTLRMASWSGSDWVLEDVDTGMNGMVGTDGEEPVMISAASSYSP